MVGIVILNRNKQEYLLSCIRSVYNQCYKSFVIIVVDNGSTDNSCAMIKSQFPEAHLIQNISNLGVAGRRNNGFNFLIQQHINVEYILFLDNDTILHEKALQEIVSSFGIKPNIGIVTPKLLRLDGTFEYAGGIDLNLTTGRISNIGAGRKDIGQYDYSTENISACGGIFAIRTKLLSELHGFDERFNPYGWEDVDLSIRLRKMGYKIYYNYKSIIYHNGGRSSRGFIKEYELSKTRNYFYLIKKHSNLLQVIIFYLILPFRLLMIVSGQIKRKEIKLLVHQFNGLFDNFTIRNK